MGKYIPSESIAGFLFVLGAIVTVPSNAMAAKFNRWPNYWRYNYDCNGNY
jgi:AGZA family xanthine/uracil permease-like MFS transporter